MNKRERLTATILGEEVDRVPVSLWRHQPVDDQTGTGLAAATLAFQREFDFDFVKVTPASSYCLRDWGVEDTWHGHYHGTRVYGPRRIRDVSDWASLSQLDPRDGQMGEVLRALDGIREGLAGETPFIQTIFSPLVQAKNLVGNEGLLVHMRKSPGALHEGLRRITNQTRRFLEAALECGIDGVFYAVQLGSYENLNDSEYEEFGRQYDLQVLELASDLWLNVLHLHGSEIMFDNFMDYPCAVLNWHDRETSPSLAEGLASWGGAVCGGIRQEETLMAGDPDTIRAESKQAIEATGGKRFILGTGCVAPIVTPFGNLKAVRQVVEQGGD